MRPTACHRTDRASSAPRRNLTKVVVSEAGASVYSASAYASQELPDLDVSMRGAVSIARRLQDPLAELVKIDPKSIGVGQYQHDVSETLLARSLGAVVEDAVNAVGVDVNTASVPLLSRVSGIAGSLAESIVAHRDQNGPFRDRRSAEGCPAAGAQGFRAVRRASCGSRGGEDPLDASRVHPEAYPVVRRIVGSAGRRMCAKLIGNTPSCAPRSRRIRRRALRPADSHRHHLRAGEAGTRPAPGIQDRRLSPPVSRRWPT